MPTDIRAHRKARRYHDRRCEECQRGTDGISHWCRRHLKRRRMYGSSKVTQHLRHKEYAYLIGVATKFLKKNPPSSDIRESVLRFLQPPGMVKNFQRGGGQKRSLLISEMARWGDPRYRKRWTDYSGYRRKANYSPRGILAVLIAVQTYIEEREGQGFPGDSDQFEMMFALTRLWKRPRRMGGAKGIRYSHRLAGTVIRELVRRWREFNTLSLYVLTTARAIVKEQDELRTAQRKVVLAAQEVTQPRRKGTIRQVIVRKVNADAPITDISEFVT